jgi:endonuclease G
MKILDMPCTKGFMQIAQDGVDKGWHEMNGGNLSYRLTKDEVLTRKANRESAFLEDPEVRTGSAISFDYQGSGYDRGHLAPAGDMHWSAKTMLESFYMSNMSPQEPSFNRGIWSKLEKAVRRFAYSEGSVVVVTGPIVTADDTKTIGHNKVRVPGFYYKVIYDETPPEKMIAFILPNKGSNKPVESFVVTVDDVEEATGLDFFSALPKETQDRLESKSNPKDWKWK